MNKNKIGVVTGILVFGLYRWGVRSEYGETFVFSESLTSQVQPHKSCVEVKVEAVFLNREVISYRYI